MPGKFPWAFVPFCVVIALSCSNPRSLQSHSTTEEKNSPNATLTNPGVENPCFGISDPLQKSICHQELALKNYRDLSNDPSLSETIRSWYRQRIRSLEEDLDRMRKMDPEEARQYREMTQLVNSHQQKSH